MPRESRGFGRPLLSQRRRRCDISRHIVPMRGLLSLRAHAGAGYTVSRVVIGLDTCLDRTQTIHNLLEGRTLDGISRPAVCTRTHNAQRHQIQHQQGSVGGLKRCNCALSATFALPLTFHERHQWRIGAFRWQRWSQSIVDHLHDDLHGLLLLVRLQTSQNFPQDLHTRAGQVRSKKQ